MFARISLCLALGLLVAALVCGNPWLCRAGDAAVVAPALPAVAVVADEVCPDAALQALVVAFHRDAHGEARWRTSDGREWRRNPEPVGGPLVVEVEGDEDAGAGAEASALR